MSKFWLGGMPSRLFLAGFTALLTTIYADTASAQRQSVPAPTPVATTVFQEVDPAARAKSAAQAFASHNYRVRLGAVLGALANVGVPVIGSDGNPLPNTGIDPIGLPWVHVAGVANASPSNSLPLSDVIRLFDQPGARPRPAPGDEANRFVEYLRLALVGGSVAGRFFANLISESNRRLGGPDLSKTSTTAEKILVDGPTMTVIVGRYLRSYLLQFSEGPRPVSWYSSQNLMRHVQFSPLTSSPIPGPLIGPLPPSTPPQIPFGNALPIPLGDCSTDGMDGWGMWIVSKIFGGVAIGGPLSAVEKEFQGAFVEILEKATKIDKVNGNFSKMAGAAVKAGSYFSSILTMWNFIYQIAYTEASVVLKDSEPLIRTKKSREHGEPKDIFATVKIGESPPWRSGMDIDIINCLAMMSVGIGNNTLFPKPGPIANVEVEIEGAEGFADRLMTAGSTVLFGPTFDRKKETNQDGQVQWGVMGRSQKRDLSESAKPVKKKFSIFISATLEPTNASSLGKTFLDSAICALAPGVACADVIADILKGIHWNLGGVAFELRDWSHGWVLTEEYDEPSFYVRAKDVNCDSEYGPWNIKREVGYSNGSLTVENFKVTFDSGGNGSFNGSSDYFLNNNSLCSSRSDGFGTAQLTPNAEGFELVVTHSIMNLYRYNCPNPSMNTSSVWDSEKMVTTSPGSPPHTSQMDVREYIREFQIQPATTECN